MARASGLSAEVESRNVPFLPGAMELAEAERFPGGTVRNLQDLGDDAIFPASMPLHHRHLLADAQTSGGLLMSVEPGALDQLRDALAEAAPYSAIIGKMNEGPPGKIQVI
jgi:selenide,water dikinase